MRIGNEYAAKTLCKAVQACYNFSVYTEDGTNETTGRSCMENKLIRSKYFLYLTEFFAGMSVMAVELGASRLMAPYFSSSQIVWTVIIGVIMIAMAIGNVWGGKLADKSATPDKLYRRLIIAAIWIALIPFVGRYLKFDVIMVDAYQDITIPFQLSSVEFFNEVQAHLKPNGVMVVNLNMTSAEDGSINEYLCDTMASVFRHTVTAPVRGNTNTEVFCTNADDWEKTFLRSIARLKDSDYADMMRTVYSKLTPYEGGSCILTDDKAPVEVLGMRVLDELIGDELNYYKDELRTGGLSALIGN